MTKKVKTIEVEAKDFYGEECLQDNLNASGNRSDKSNPSGYVKIYEVDDKGNKKLLGKHNLVLYQGREWLAQRMLYTENENVASTRHEFLTWFGLGDGGVIPGDPFNPAPPVLTDNELNSKIMITAIDSSAADYNMG